jgi:hypothetical protein
MHGFSDVPVDFIVIEFEHLCESILSELYLIYFQSALNIHAFRYLECGLVFAHGLHFGRARVPRRDLRHAVRCTMACVEYVGLRSLRPWSRSSQRCFRT